jgi:hypothetical protein
MLIRVRTKDGTERLQVENGATLKTLRTQIASQLTVPFEQQVALSHLLPAVDTPAATVLPDM